jgi:hypothetical protein
VKQRVTKVARKFALAKTEMPSTIRRMLLLAYIFLATY